MSTDQAAAQERAAAYYAGLDAYGVSPLWRQLQTLLPKEPKSRAVPHVWRYQPIREQLMTAGELISAEEAERRVLMLINPGLAPAVETANNIYAGIQLVLPGEIAPMHRHTPAAFRIIIEGSGAYTTVDGERTYMQPGDVVLTPGWAWHDHGNTTDEPMIWMDGLDLPLSIKLESIFFDEGPEHAQDELVPADSSARLYAGGRLNPTWESWDRAYSPVVNYPFARTEEILRSALADWAGTPADGVMFEFTNPIDGSSVMPTLGIYAQALAPHQHTDAHQHTSSTIYHVLRGRGQTIVDGEVLDWEEHDTFAVPGWAVHEHVNTEGEEAILFSHSDAPVQRALGYYREQACERQA